MPDLSSLAAIPFYGAYAARTQQNEQQGNQDLQQLGTLMQIQKVMQENRMAKEDITRNEQLRQEISALPPDQRTKENVLPLVLKYTRNPKEIAPLLREEPKPISMGAGGLYDPKSGKVISPAHMPETELGKLLRERQTLPEGHPNIPAYNAAIANLQAKAPASYHVVKDPASSTGWSYKDLRTDKIVAKEAPAPAADAALQATLGAIPPQHRDLRGDDYLQTLPSGMAALVKKVASGEADPSKIASMRAGNREVLMQRVLQYDPSYNAVRHKNWQEFTTGQTAKNITSLNMAISHLGTFAELGDALQNGDVRAFNAAKNRLAHELGRPELNNLQISSQAVGEELMRVFRQVNASESEARMFMERLGSASSPAQIKGAASTMVELLKGRLNAINGQWKRGSQTDQDFPGLLDEKSKVVLKKLGLSLGENPSPTQSMPSSGWSIRPL